MIKTNKDIQVEVRKITKEVDLLTARMRILESDINSHKSLITTAATRRLMVKMNDAINLLSEYSLGDDDR